MNRDSILLEADELLTKIDQPNIRVYDATIAFFRKDGGLTAHEQYLQGHIPGAAFFDHEDFSDPNSSYKYMVLSEHDLAAQIGNIGIDEDSEVIFYTSDLLACATRAWWVLRYAGHNNVRVLNGGLAAWKEAGGAIEQGGNEYTSTTFDCTLRSHMFAAKEEVLAAMDEDAICTVNTLSSSIYEQAHISGSSNHPFTNLMNDSIAFVANDVIADHLKPETQYERVITYCGGGIAATVNAIAHLMAGNQNIAVYDGSMFEWSGEGLPITNGQLS